MKKNIRFIFTLFAVALLCLTADLTGAFAQSNGGGNTVSGQVKNASGGSVAGATVTIYARETNARAATQTDADGKYRFERIAAGSYIVEAAGRGFGRTSEIVRVETGAQATTVDLTLKIAGPSETVTITAAGTSQTVDEVSKAVSVVTADEIERRDEFNLADAIRTTPGVRVQQLGGPGSLIRINTRGLRDSDTAVLVDGIRLRDAASTQGDATSFISELNFVNSDRVEVVRGSGSSLYGTNAIGGVVNVITEQGGAPTNGEVQFEAGGLGLFRGRTKLSGGFDENRFVYSGGLALLNVTDGVNDTPTRNFTGQGFAQYNFTPKISLGARVYGNTAYLALTDSPFTTTSAAILPGFILPPVGSIVDAIPLALDQQRRIENRQTVTNRGNANFVANLRDPDNRRDSDFLTVALFYNQRINDRFGYRVSYNRANTNRKSSDGPGGNRFEPVFNSFSTFDGRIDTFNIQGDAQLGRYNLLTFGYEFENEKYIGTNTDENPNQTLRANAGTVVTQRSNAFFVQNQFRAFDNRFQASVAFRTQNFDLKQPVFTGGTSIYSGRTYDAPKTAYTGDGSISYFFRETGMKIRAHIGSGYRAPSLYERFGSGFFQGVFSPYGDPRLAPERSIAVDGGVDQKLFNDRMQLSATYFYTRLQEVIVFDSTGLVAPATDPFGRFGGYTNTGGGIARGAEFAFNAKPYRSLDISSSYTFTNARNRVATSVPGFLQTFFQPRHTFTVAAAQRVGERVEVIFDMFAYSSYFFPFSQRVYRFSGPVKADVGGSYTLPIDDRRSIRFYAKIENVFNREYFENGFRTPKAYFVGGANFRF